MIASARIPRRATGAILVFLGSILACSELDQGPVAALDPQEVHQALLRQFEYEGPSLFVVEPLTPEMYSATPMDASEVEYHRRAGMDIDEELANELARALGGARLTVEIPLDNDRLREWDGRPLDRWESSPHFFSVEGQQAALLRLFPVAFSHDGERALTYLDISCGPSECGLGLVVLLRRTGVEWILESTSMTWQS